MDLQRRLGILGFDPSHDEFITWMISKAAGGHRKNGRHIAGCASRMLSGMDPDTIEGSIETVPGTAADKVNTLKDKLRSKANYAILKWTMTTIRRQRH